MHLNSLSVFLWLADVIYNFSTAAQICFFLLGVAMIALFIVSVGISDDAKNISSEANQAAQMQSARRMRTWAVATFILSFIVWWSMWLVPSTRTMYLIAGSQVGEQVVASPEGKEMLDLIQNKIKEILAPAVKP